MSAKTTHAFKPRARIILQMGDQLIRNAKIALFELVKNAYDADASFVKVTMKNIDDEKKREIVIMDDGTGMDKETLVKAWMEPGTDYREEQFQKREKTKKFKRLPIGEKGIGRFALHKLGNTVEITTKKKGHPELRLKIDWRRFKKKDYLSKIKVAIEKNVSNDFQDGETGTNIRISNLRQRWTRGSIRDAYRAITSIVNPFEFDVSKFLVQFVVKGKPEIFDGLMESEEIKDYALWYAEIKLSGNKLKMDYQFNPWKVMRKKINTREITFEDDILEADVKKPKTIDLSPYRIGDLRIILYVFDRDRSVMNLLKGEKSQLVKFLNNNGGMRVYRDGIRVYDYGEKGNDWLGLDIRRVNIPAKRISNNIVVGAVFLKREESEDLEEKTNREGFVENDALRIFNKAILGAISVFEGERQIDKFEIRKYFGPTKQSEPIYETFNKLRNKIEQKIKNKELRESLVRYVTKAETEYNEIRDILLTSSGAGLSLSIVIHEIEKIVTMLLKSIKREKSSEKISDLVHHLAELTKGFTALIRSSDMQKNNLKEIIEQALFNVEYRLEAHDITIVDRYSGTELNTEIKCSRNYILMVIMNIIDNSIWWLQKEYKKEKGIKRIYLKLTEDEDKNLQLIIADNGPGFSIPSNYARKPFISKKPGGMGLGLYISDEIMKSHGGQLQFPETGDISLPKKFRNGAVLRLLFERGKVK